LDPRADQTSVVRSSLLNILNERMRDGTKSGSDGQLASPSDGQTSPQPPNGAGSLLPPLAFNHPANTEQPTITERSGTQSRPSTGDQANAARPTFGASMNANEEQQQQQNVRVTDRPMNRGQSPAPPEKDIQPPFMSPPRRSQDSVNRAPRSEASIPPAPAGLADKATANLPALPTEAGVQLHDHSTAPESSSQVSRGEAPQASMSTPSSVQPRPWLTEDPHNKESAPPSVPFPSSEPPQITDDSFNLASVAGALYFMQNEGREQQQQHHNVPTAISEHDDDEDNSDNADMPNPRDGKPLLVAVIWKSVTERTLDSRGRSGTGQPSV
jgi:hypothetical protein